MNCTVPFKKNIKFPTEIAEITSISLEHEITINDESLLGNFLISGEYKEHPVSVNTEPFHYNIPFDVALPSNVQKDTITFEISDFTYEVNSDSLDLNIEFVVKGDEVKEEEEIVATPINEPIEIDELFKEEVNTTLDNTDSRNNDNKKSVMDIATNSEETFVTYRIHIVHSGDTKDLIAQKYNISEELLEDYNDMANLTPGSKLIIPIDE